MKINQKRLGWVVALCAATVSGCSGGTPPISLVEDDAGALPDAHVVDPGTDAGPPRECATGCFVDGVCFRDGAVNPANPCEVCDTAFSQSAFADNDGASCDDGAFCTVGDSCSRGVCLGPTARSCDDGVACTSGDRCDESADSCVPGAPSCAGGLTCDLGTGSCSSDCSGCAIGGVCYVDGDRNPANPCEICDASRSGSAWTSNDGARCDDGAFCTVGDSCRAGSCVGAPRDCDDGVACSGLEVCSEVSDRCLPGTTECAAGTVCAPETDSCEASCLGCSIGGVCYAAGDANPMNSCEVCSPARSRATWSANDGLRCDDGLFCTENDVCSAGVCRGAARSCGDGVACNGVEACDEAANECARGASACPAGLLCSPASDSCVDGCAGCSIGGVCYAAGTENPLNGCEICRPSQSRAGWSPNDGAICEDGSFCTVDDTCSARACISGTARSCDDGVACNGAESCDEGADSCAAGSSTCAATEECDPATDSCVACSGCSIGGVCFADGEVNPFNECERCDVGTSPSAWSPRDGAVCDDGAFCTTGDTCSAGACVGSALDCDDGVSCNGVETCSNLAGACVPGGSTCTGFEVCDPDTDSCVDSCGGCTIDGSCFAVGAANPANPCEVCGAAGDTAWSSDFGATCDDGVACTTGDVCTVAGCAGAAVVCDDGIACNGMESCEASSGLCGDGTPTCAPDETCNESLDLCEPTCAGCAVFGSCFADGDPNPGNPCEICDVTVSRSSFSPNDGASCSDGSLCTTGDTCAASLCEGTPVVCDDGVSCNGAELCDGDTGSCVAGVTTCPAETTCDLATDTCLCDGCYIDGHCLPVGTVNRADRCSTCAAVGDTDWTPTPDGGSCDDELSCTDGDVCTAGVCAGTDTCPDGTSCDPVGGLCLPPE
jgi:hypothetical protein